MNRSVVVTSLCLFLAAPAVAQEEGLPSFWSIHDRVEEVVVPGCQEICEHVLGLVRKGLPKKEAIAFEKGFKDLMNDCVPACETDLDIKTRRCVFAAVDMDAFDMCREESEARLPPPPPPPPVVEVDETPPIRMIQPSLPTPTCEAVCRHILELSVLQIPAETAQSAPGQVQEYLPQCIAECEQDLDDQARRCFIDIPSFEAGSACDEALDGRRTNRLPNDIPFWEENLSPTD